MSHLFNKFKNSINNTRQSSSTTKVEDKTITYPSIYPKSYSFSEPWTFQKDRLERGCNDYGSKRAIELYGKHKYKLENQWINPLQGINSGLGTANLSLYNYQVVDFIECSFLAQDPLMNNIFDILSTTPLSKGGKLKIIGYDDNNESLITEIEQLALKYKLKDTIEVAKEPFMYTLLSRLGFSPEVHFIINPYITGGFFIATADLNDETKREKFFEIGHIAGIPKRIDVATGLEDENVGFVRLFDIELRKQSPKAKKQAVFVELTKVDMLARIFRLEDFNTGNFGCIVKVDELEENRFTKTCLNTCVFKVIDFATHGTDQYYIDHDIVNNFMGGNTTIRYSDNSIMARALKNRPEQEKFFFGFQALFNNFKVD